MEASGMALDSWLKPYWGILGPENEGLDIEHARY